MADGTYVVDVVKATIEVTVAQAMEERAPFSLLCQRVAAAVKTAGGMVYTTARDSGDICVYHAASPQIPVRVQETELYQQAVPLSTW